MKMVKRWLALFLTLCQTLFQSSLTFTIFRGGDGVGGVGRPLTTFAAAALSSSISSDPKKKKKKNGKNSAAVVSAGLNNLGNTCYLNAQLQCSFHIPYIRQLILDPNTAKSKSESLGLAALRQVFSSMLSSPLDPVSSTRILCQTLGINVFEQQDSQEFWKLLLPLLEHSSLLDVYQGAMEDYIIAQDDSGRERRREEPFLDLSLEVQNTESVYETMKQTFTQPELLSVEEGNGWRPEKGADKVDALKGSLLRVQGLPSVLQLHLKRFQYNWQTDTMSKINDAFLFPEELDLSTLCADITPEEVQNSIYDLQSIVVHKGAFGSGHYYSYVRPDMSSKRWYRFDDHRVTEVDYYEDVIRDAFGGRMETCEKEDESTKPRGFWGRVFGGRNKVGGYEYGYGGRYSNAYMLQYVKRSDITKLYKP